MARENILDFLGRGVALAGRGAELASRVERLGPMGMGVLAWNALPQSTRERVLGEVCSFCGEAQSLCECCVDCGYSPCACPGRFSIEVEGVAVE